MSARTRFAIAVIILFLLMTGPFLLTAFLIYQETEGAEREALLTLLQPRLPLGTILTALGFFGGLLLLRQLFRQYVQGLQTMSEHLRLMLGANRDFRIATEGAPPEVMALTRAANDLADQRNTLLDDVDKRISEAKASVEEEKNRLAALMSELTLGIIVCNLDGRILLYNNRALLLFQALQTETNNALIGLGRSIFSILERNHIAHALDNIERNLDKTGQAAAANFVTAVDGGQLLRIQMAPVLRSEGVSRISGYVLIVENITRNIERETERNQLMQMLTDENRAGLGTMRITVEALCDDSDMPAELRQRFFNTLREETLKMSDRINDATHRFADALKSRWPLEEILGIDIIAAAQHRIETQLNLATKIETLDERLWIRADSFALIQAITFLASRLVDHYQIRELRFRLSHDGNMAFVDLIWLGQTVSSEALLTWEFESMTVGGDANPLTLREVINRHSGEIWYQREKAAHRAYFRIVLPAVDAPEPQLSLPNTNNSTNSRPEYYDFDLFRATDATIGLDRKLSELAYSIFDTETTGLEPSKGDEIIQIGAVRVVNGRMLPQEIFEQLINPKIPLKPESIAIHGITEDMVRHQPDISKVLPKFHSFCSETVLVAHNAAFDMRFLQLKEATTGVIFTQPLLDTLLLSAVIHPGQDSHRLEAIAERFGINIIGRHTALGDAFVTAEVFLKMLPLLADQGIVTLRQALEAAQKTYYARIQY